MITKLEDVDFDDLLKNLKDKYSITTLCLYLFGTNVVLLTKEQRNVVIECQNVLEEFGYFYYSY